MTEHKYTDEEVIKALERCGSSYKGDTSARCSGCPLNEVELEPAACFDTLLHDLSLDLINRQKAEVERLNAEKDNFIKTYKFCMVEAIKEFAEKLGSYEEVVTTLKDGENIVAIDVHHIHRLVKEMTGENNQ